MKYIYVFTFILLLVIKNCSSQSSPASNTYTVTIYDHHPSLNPDFEYPLQHGDVTTGLVSSTLNNVPQFIGKPGQGAINNASTFSQWFQNTPGVNIPLNLNLTFTQNTTDQSKYYLINEHFFPINEKGWDAVRNSKDQPTYERYKDGDGVYQNFHFCLHFSASFFFKGTETFVFAGDDDVWLYINNTLRVDLGGIHEMANYTLDFAKIGIKPGDYCNFDFFYCERHTVASEITITTGLDLKCEYIDYCGVCQGKGACCNAQVDCNDNNPCTIDRCPTDFDNSSFTNGNWKNYCTHTPVVCPANDKCDIASCNTTSGNCVHTPRVCPPKTCNSVVCNPNLGCQYTPIVCPVDDKCNNYYCDSTTGNTCKSTPVNCNDNDPCTIDTCNQALGCQHKAVECASCSKCSSGTCVPISGCVNCTTPCLPPADNCQKSICVNGACSTVPNIVSDNNPCTNDYCVSGTTYYSAINCNNTDQCKNAACNATSGNCVFTPINCDDSNPCTIDSCTNGTCKHTLNTCDDGDYCTVDSCSETSGCLHTPMVCPTSDACTIATCDSASRSCKNTSRVCPEAEDFCKIPICNLALGCLYIDRACIPDNPDCQYAVCNNVSRECQFKNYSPTPFSCISTAIKAGIAIGAAAIAGIVIGGAVALGLAIFGGKKGYELWKASQDNKISGSNTNPLYQPNPNSGENPIYQPNE